MRDDKMTNKQKNRYIPNHKTTNEHGFSMTGGIYDNMEALTVKKCKVGLKVLTRAGLMFAVESIIPQHNRHGDVTVVTGNGEYGSIYGSYNGVFPSLKIQGVSK